VKSGVSAKVGFVGVAGVFVVFNSASNGKAG
jgi:hypothetical protein